MTAETTPTPDPADAFRQLEHRFRTLIEQIPAITYTELTGDAESLTAYMSPQVFDILGYAPERFPTMDVWLEVIHAEDRDRVIAIAERAEETGDAYSVEYRVLAHDGRVVWLRDEARVIEDPVSGQRFWQGVMFDITAEKGALEALQEAKTQIEYMAYHDALTGLANRAMFDQFLAAALARARRAKTAVAVLYMDLDGFKIVNDTHGHLAGDELLRQFAQRLETATRETDLVARLGGDEFLVLAADIDTSGEDQGLAGATAIVSDICSRVKSSMEVPFRVGDVDVSCGVSIGSGIFPVDGEDGDALLKHADAAMYRQKSGS